MLVVGLAQAAEAQVTTLGRAMNGALEREAQTIRDAGHGTTRRPASAEPKPAHAAVPRPTGRSAKGKVVEQPLGTGDPLAGTDATTCRQANGTTIRVSGSYRPPAEDGDECR